MVTLLGGLMGPTEICNQALARIGAKRINDFGDSSDNKTEALYSRLFYEQTAKALMRSHFWRFAKDRVQLSQDTVTPSFQWTYQYHLPSDFLRAMLVYDGSDAPDGHTYYTYELEGDKLMTTESTVYLKYIKWVSDVPSWDSLFVEVMVLMLAKKVAMPLTQNVKLKEDIERELEMWMRRVRAMDREEGETIGRYDLLTWNDARYSDRA
jgi:hypothetical protein